MSLRCEPLTLRTAMVFGLMTGGVEILLGRWTGGDRVEAGLFLLWRPVVLAGLALMLARSPRRARAAGYAAMLAAATGLEAVLAGWAPGVLAVGFGLAALIDPVMRAGVAMGGRWLAAAALALLLAVPGAGRWAERLAGTDGRPVATGERVAVLAGVPLRWAEGVELAGSGPAWTLLTHAFALEAVERIGAARAARWLLVQPRAPGPAGLVAIDARIRGGVRAVILTDPDLRWPSRYPPGDAAAPPRGGTLAPLLRHWGLVLERGAPGLAVRDLDWGGRRWRLALAGAGRFVAAGPGPCRVTAGGLIARCAIGRGQAVLVADADLLDPTLWADPDSGHAPAFRASDNAAFVIALLAAPDRISPPARPVRWRDPAPISVA